MGFESSVNGDTKADEPTEQVTGTDVAGNKRAVDVAIKEKVDLVHTEDSVDSRDRETAVLANIKAVELLELTFDDFVFADDEIISLADGTLIKANI